MLKTKIQPTVIERFLLPNPQWQEGYKSFNILFEKPMGWIYLVGGKATNRIIRLDHARQCAYYSASKANQKRYMDYLLKFSEMTVADEESSERLPTFFKTPFDKEGAVFSITHLGKIKGLLFLCSLKKNRKDLRSLLDPFNHYLQAQVELAYKNFELNNFYETVHPRALALSTMHSVHRVISASLRLNELLPRIGRLSAQVLKAQGCSIMLCDSEGQYLIPNFSFGKNSKFIHHQRVRIGRGIEGKIAKTGEILLGRKAIGVPFIEEDVVGVITLWDKLDEQSFSKTDLEILKSLSEQAVVAIKNAQLYEETEQLTLGSIKAINDLLNVTVGEERSHIPVFGKIALEVGKELGLSGRELTYLERALSLLNTGALTMTDKIWEKKGKLTKKEYQLMKRIPMKGASLLKSISSLKPIVPIVLHHRERYDGLGYPHGLKQAEIPIGARIVSVVDSFIAMISKSVYSEVKSVKKAITEINDNSGTQFDPEVVNAFLKVIERKEIIDEINKI